MTATIPEPSNHAKQDPWCVAYVPADSLRSHTMAAAHSDFWVSIAQDRFLHESHTSIEEIDRDMAGLAEALRRGRARRNRMTLASIIPPEILAVIFEFVKQESFGEYEDMGDKERGNGEVEESKVKVMGWITFSVRSVTELMRRGLISI